MDAVLFLKEKHRMCKEYKVCMNCPLSSDNNGHCIICSAFVEEHPEKAVAIVEQWSKENPIWTKCDQFFKLFPNAPMESSGCPIDILPCYLGWCEENDCQQCKYIHETTGFCWNMPYKEPTNQ